MMSNEEEKRCPLCAEEMDWTDLQFMPCKCGYQICVWCWHHIIDMAEKDETEGRCPACRVIYEKEKIVAMQANCKSTMTKNSSKKTKPPKAKPKVVNEVKKDLTNIRVIQRKMAYVIGLPLSLADEDVLLRKEYFGQYGKVTKVSLSRTAGGAVQQFINDTCSVYITYSKEEEALRCIQSVHGFVLEGRFLRASFGTAKYCHAWLKNMPCNNSACLYLHSFGADEDSFGKDEVAAVHTRSRVQEIVGSANNMVKRTGNVLPSPFEDTNNSNSSFTDKSTIRSRISVADAAYGSTSGSSDRTCTFPSHEREGAIAGSHKMTTFVDIVGRSKSTPDADRDILNVSSELSSVSINGDIHAGQPYSIPTISKTSSSNHVANGFSKNITDEPLRKESSLLDNQESKDHRAFFFRSSYPSNISDDSGGGPIVDHHNTVHNHERDAYLCQEMKFQNSAKSDRIYRSSKSFSNEEIVQHLRRIGDNDDNLANGEENSVLDAVESSIISNIMSMDFDSCEDSLAMTKTSELLDENDGLGNSSWSSLNSDQSGYSFVKHDGFANQLAPGSMLPDFRDSKEQYLCKPQYPVSRTQSLAPPGFSIPSRDPPPGFSSSERTSCISRASSAGSRLYNASSFSNHVLQPSSKRLNGSNSIDEADFFDHTLLNSTQGNRANGFKNPSSETRPAGLSAFDDESRLWLLMQQQSHQDSKFSQIFAPQNIASHQELSYTSHMGNGSTSRLVDDHQSHTNPSFFTQLSHQKYANGHISNEVGIADVQRNERLGGVNNNYFSGYGDMMFSSGDVYTRVFGL